MLAAVFCLGALSTGNASDRVLVAFAINAVTYILFSEEIIHSLKERGEYYE